jgi:hypothetical protein
VADEVHYRDFTKKRKPVRFKIDDDHFHCVEALLPDTLQELLSAVRTRAEDSETDRAAAVVAKLRDIFKLFLLDDSYEVFEARLGNPRKPIDIQQLLEIIQWIVEVYTKGRSTLSSDSSDSSVSVGVGTSSTAGALPVELMH